MLVAMLLVACRGASPGAAENPPGPVDPGLNPAPPALADQDPDPMVFEADLTASATTWEYADGKPVNGLSFGGTVPGPLIRVPVGARVLIHFHNDLPDGFETTIHWHGIEGNNAADGTPTTQFPVEPGASFDYDFVVTRPGMFWYHPHIRGAQSVFDGLYAPLIVDDPDESSLVAKGVVPADERILVLSDLGEYEGTPFSAEVDDATVTMNGTEGEHLLVNGREDPVFEIPAGAPVRLRVLNASIARFWRLAVPGYTLYRIGGQGGLLDAVRVEGGTVGATVTALSDGAPLPSANIDLGYDRGEILLGPAERADLVLVPDGNPGDELRLVWKDYARGRHGMWMDGDTMVMGPLADDGTRPDEDVATFHLVAGDSRAWLAEGNPVLGAVGRSVGTVDPTAALDWTGDKAMVLSENMDMFQDDQGVWQMTSDLYIDGQSWEMDHMGGPDQPEAPTAVHAKLGDTLDWEFRNEAEMAHPIHLHGFSYEPISWSKTDEAAGTVSTWPVGYDERVDTTVLPALTSLFVRVKLDDPLGDGQAAGRWMRHCHIFQHGEAGMMSELIVDP